MRNKRRKRIVILVSVLLSSFFMINAQQFEPKWVGAVNILSIDNDTACIAAEKANVQVKTTQSAGRILFDIGNVRQKGIIKGSKSNVQCDMAKPIYIVVKCKENDVDPNTFIQIVKFEETKKERKTELAMENWLGNTSEMNSILVPYEADKYGKSSYILRMEPQEGEFGVRVFNPEAVDSRAPVFYCFGSHFTNGPVIIKSSPESTDEKVEQELYNYNGILYPLLHDSDGKSYIMINKDSKVYVI